LTKPHIDDTSNLTGGQIQQVLDFLIYRGLEPIIRHSCIFDVQLIHLLSVASTNKKRKVSALSREDFINKICTALTTNDTTVKLECITSSKMERGFVYNFLVNFLNSASDYNSLYTQYLTCTRHVDKVMLDRKMLVIENALSFSRSNLFYVLNIVRKYVEFAYEFRNKIVSQYIKHAYKQAHVYCKTKGENFDFDDVYQSLMTAITKALDKYDSSKGALTSYINYWVLNALTYANPSYGHEYGVAYLIPQTQKKVVQGTKAENVNFSVSLNSLLDEDSETSLGDILVSSSRTEDDYIEAREAEDLSYLIKCADPKGLARLYLDLAEYISVKEKTRMAESMKQQLGYYPKEFKQQGVSNEVRRRKTSNS
jgi:hypothetical protein